MTGRLTTLPVRTSCGGLLPPPPPPLSSLSNYSVRTCDRLTEILRLVTIAKDYNAPLIGDDGIRHQPDKHKFSLIFAKTCTLNLVSDTAPPKSNDATLLPYMESSVCMQTWLDVTIRPKAELFLLDGYVVLTVVLWGVLGDNRVVLNRFQEVAHAFWLRGWRHDIFLIFGKCTLCWNT